MRALLTAALTLSAAAAFADETTGTILAFDRQADVIVLDDKTVWELQPTTLIPADLAAGDTVTITYQTAGEDGVTSIDALEKN